MINYYITEFKQWLDGTVPTIINEKYFSWLMGSIFLFGIVTKWVVVMNYDRLIKKAENMTNPKNATLRQIKMKFESIKQVNGYVANPMLLVQRHINKCKTGIFSLNKLNNIIKWFIIIIIGISGLIGYELYQTGNGKTTAMAYILTGCFFAFALEMINRCVRVKDRQMELAYVIVDFLENSALSREERNVETLDVLTSDSADMEKESLENEQNIREEQILNQVIGEFLQ